nr:YciI family protein [Candidatus Mcinerneyibacteriales bacterium]
AFLKKGSKRAKTQAEADRLQKAHLENISRLAREGSLILAGPFLDEGDLRGIYLFDTENLDEARQLVKSDPAIQAGSLVMELKEWYGSAALMAVPQIHPMVEKRSVAE